MDKEILEALIALGVDRPIQAYRMIGNRRIEVHLLGDYEPTVFDLSGTIGDAEAEPEAQPGGGADQAGSGPNAHALGLAKVGNDPSLALSGKAMVKTLGELKIKELKEIARRYGINPYGARKAELIELITAEVHDGNQPG